MKSKKYVTDEEVEQMESLIDQHPEWNHIMNYSPTIEDIQSHVNNENFSDCAGFLLFLQKTQPISKEVHRYINQLFFEHTEDTFANMEGYEDDYYKSEMELPSGTLDVASKKKEESQTTL